MQATIIIVITGLIGFLLFTKRLKPNMISAFLLTLSAISVFYILHRDGNNGVAYATMKSEEQFTEVYNLYSNDAVSFDVQVARTLSPYKQSDSKVMEPNSAVTDGVNIYSISKRSVIVTDAKTLVKTKSITFDGENYKPMFLFVTGDKLIVVGELNKGALVYIYNKDDFSLYKTAATDASYITSRIIDDKLYLAASKMIENKLFTKGQPMYAINGVKHYKPLTEVYYISGTYANNFVDILKIDLEDKERVNMATYLGLGQTLYFSENNLYAAEQKFALQSQESNKSLLIKFFLGDLSLAGVREVSGYILDQYSLDEYNGYLRAATSTEKEAGVKEANNIYILNNEMKITGSILNFSEGSEIQAATFIGDKAYIETFNILDPFYVIDLSNVKKPVIVSELKFDGYSTNFIPYDKSHIIAFGLVLDDNKRAEGLKVTIFDVTDPQKVKLVSSDTIMYSQYNSAYSDALYDKKSVLVDRKNAVLGFPIVYWITEGNNAASYYKQFFLVYQITPDFKLSRLGTVSHYEKGQMQSADDDIRNGIVLDKDLYTVSEMKIKENRLTDLKPKKELIL